MPMNMPVPMRRIPFENIANFRDLGGYACIQGMTAWGRVFRSARLTHATRGEIGRIRDLGIRTVIDLRMAEEVRMRPDAGMEDSGMAYEQISLLGEDTFDMKALEENPDAVPPMSTLYLYMLDNCQPHFKAVIERIAAGLEQGGVLFHCTAGKDRTGLIAMLLQSLCGVDHLDIIAHYEVSHTYNLDFMPEDTTGSIPTNMITVLEMLEKRYGGAIQYLEGIGVAQRAMDAIRARMVQAL